MQNSMQKTNGSRISLYFFLLCIVFLQLAPDAALAGKDSGGGNGTSSTPTEVVSDLSLNLGMVPGSSDPKTHRAEGRLLETLLDLHNAFAANPVLPIRDPRAATIIGRILQLPYFEWIPNTQRDASDDTIDPSPFEEVRIKADFETTSSGSCSNGAQERDASVRVEQTAKGAVPHICVSALRLSRYPSNEIIPQLTALFMHEFAHLAGYGETDAIYVQKFVLGLLSQQCQITISLPPVSPDSLPSLKPGREVGDMFYVRIPSSMMMSVEFLRFLKPGFGNIVGPGLGNGNDVIRTKTSLSPKDFALSWSPEGSGSLKFQALGTNGYFAFETIQWTSLVPSTLGEAGYTAKNPTGSVRIDGKTREISSIAINSACVR